MQTYKRTARRSHAKGSAAGEWSGERRRVPYKVVTWPPGLDESADGSAVTSPRREPKKHEAGDEEEAAMEEDEQRITAEEEEAGEAVEEKEKRG